MRIIYEEGQWGMRSKYASPPLGKTLINVRVGFHQNNTWEMGTSATRQKGSSEDAGVALLVRKMTHFNCNAMC